MKWRKKMKRKEVNERKKWNERVELRNKKGMRREGNERMKWTGGTKESKIKWEGRKVKRDEMNGRN